MDWNKLLSPRRVRDLFGGAPTHKSAADARNEFERDYGRLVFSTPVKRLQDKAQVFPLEQHDAVRTRLTHSMEVSSVARGLGDQVGAWLATEGKLPNGDIDPRNIATITASAGLVRDLGNPPFGHAGELAMQNWFEDRLKRNDNLAKTLGRDDRKNSQETQDMLRFEGNAQTVRLLGKLQVLADFHGLNLTSATMATVMKYSAPPHAVSVNC